MAEYKDVTELSVQIKDFKKHFNSSNSDYMTGYLCALSVTEGMIAGLPAADVVEVVRCSECEHFTEGMAIGMCKRVADKPIIPIPYNHYCSFGVKRTEKQDDKVCK